MKISFLLAAFVLLSNFAFSNDNPRVSSVESLIDSVKVIMAQEQIAGTMLGIIASDSVIYSGGLGYSDLENKIATTENTLFRLGSVTKVMVSLGILKLVETGKLDLNDNLKTVAPDVPFRNKWEATDPLKIVHLLEHTSGFDDIKLNRFCTLKPLNLSGKEKMLVQKSSFECRWRPGERYAYSNPNYAVLGYIIETVSGMPYEAYIKQEILDPLGMFDTNFNTGSQNTPKEVKEYTIKKGKIEKEPSVILWSGAAGSLWSSAADMLKLMEMFLNDGHPLFKPETIERMETPISSLAARSGLKSGYGLGNGLNFFKSKYIFNGHDGWVGTCHSGFFYIRSLNLGFVISSNSANNNRIYDLITGFLLQDFPENPLPVKSVDLNAIEPYLGRYQFDSPRNAISTFRDRLLDAPKIEIKDKKLIYSPLRGEPSELIQTGPLIFTWEGHNLPMVIFTKNSRGVPVMLIMGKYYEKRSKFGPLVYRGFLGLAALFIFSSVVLGLGSLIASFLGKIRLRKLLICLLPMIGFSGLVAGYSRLSVVQHDNTKLAELATINVNTLIIFLGTTVFGVAVIATLLFALLQLRKSKFSLFNLYYLLMAFSFAFIFVILWQHGWIGLRTWSL